MYRGGSCFSFYCHDQDHLIICRTIQFHSQNRVDLLPAHKTGKIQLLFPKIKVKPRQLTAYGAIFCIRIDELSKLLRQFAFRCENNSRLFLLQPNDSVAVQNAQLMLFFLEKKKSLFFPQSFKSMPFPCCSDFLDTIIRQAHGRCSMMKKTGIIQ